VSRTCVRRWLAGLLVTMLAATVMTVAPGAASASGRVACADLVRVPLSEVSSVSAELDSDGEAAGMTGLPEFCRVVLTVVPQVGIEVWLPTGTYNRRFQAVGGGGYAGVISYPAMANALRSGYATASTDTGHQVRDGSFALGPDGRLDHRSIEDFASRSLIEMTKKAKALVQAFYGRRAEFSYWTGCSTGGRQGLMLAQRFPDGYDGILSGAPAINWDRFVPAELWPQVVMRQELGGPIAGCKLSVATQAAVARCDGFDGVADGVLEDPRRCDFDAGALIGQVTPCSEFTAADARVVRAVWDGVRATNGGRLWYGLAPGAPLNALAGPVPFPIAENHHRYWIEQDPRWDWRTLDYAGFEQNMRESRRLFHDVIGTDDPDLSRFRASGGRLLIWHGWNDQLIFPMGTIDYYERVLRTMGNPHRVGRFARLFMAPGVQHCAGGPGPSTFDMFGELVRWVERGPAPDRIIASKVENGQVVRTRPLCAYPRVARYDGKGDPNSAASFACKPTFGQERI
jgi:Tannase and feruloyl esterase